MSDVILYCWIVVVCEMKKMAVDRLWGEAVECGDTLLNVEVWFLVDQQLKWWVSSQHTMDNMTAITNSLTSSRAWVIHHTCRRAPVLVIASQCLCGPVLNIVPAISILVKYCLVVFCTMCADFLRSIFCLNASMLAGHVCLRVQMFTFLSMCAC